MFDFDDDEGNQRGFSAYEMAGSVVQGILSIVGTLIAIAIVMIIVLWFMADDGPPQLTASQLAACRFHAISATNCP